jgi:hypothetical protein
MRKRQLAGPSSPFDRGLRLGEQEGGACFLVIWRSASGELFSYTLSHCMHIYLLIQCSGSLHIITRSSTRIFQFIGKATCTNTE